MRNLSFIHWSIRHPVVSVVVLINLQTMKMEVAVAVWIQAFLIPLSTAKPGDCLTSDPVSFVHDESNSYVRTG